jgi:hypothetical protein
MHINLDGRMIPIDTRYLEAARQARPRALNWQAEFICTEVLKIGQPNVLKAEYDCDLEV